MKRPEQEGFSLTELLIALLIILVVSAIAIPKVLETLEAYRLEAAATLLASRLTEARMSAVKLNRLAWLAIEPDAGRFRVYSTDPGSPGGPTALGPAEVLPAGLRFAEPTPGQIGFDALGRPAAMVSTPPFTVAVRVARSGLQKNVIVSPSGRIRTSP